MGEGMVIREQNKIAPCQKFEPEKNGDFSENFASSLEQIFHSKKEGPQNKF